MTSRHNRRARHKRHKAEANRFRACKEVLLTPTTRWIYPPKPWAKSLADEQPAWYGPDLVAIFDCLTDSLLRELGRP